MIFLIFLFIFLFFSKINHATSSNLYRSYYPHRSRELVSPVCGIFTSKTGGDVQLKILVVLITKKGGGVQLKFLEVLTTKTGGDVQLKSF